MPPTLHKWGQSDHFFYKYQFPFQSSRCRKCYNFEFERAVNPYFLVSLPAQGWCQICRAAHLSGSLLLHLWSPLPSHRTHRALFIALATICSPIKFNGVYFSLRMLKAGISPVCRFCCCCWGVLFYFVCMFVFSWMFLQVWDPSTFFLKNYLEMCTYHNAWVMWVFLVQFAS